MAADVRGTAQTSKEAAFTALSISNPNEVQVAAQVSLLNQGLTTQSEVSQKAVTTYNAQEVSRTPVYDEKGNVTGWTVITKDGKSSFVSNPAYKTEEVQTGNVAFDIVSSVFKSYGIDGLATQMSKIRSLYPEISSADLITMLKYDSRFNTPYLTRFSGNAERIKAGMTPLDEATYLNQEAGYKKIFSAYGLDKTYGNQATYAKLIAGDISIDEANTRVSAAYGRVLGDTNTLNAFKQFYPEISTADLAAYVLDPKIATQAIQSKVTTAEVGGQALAQGLQTAVSATTFAPETVGYENITRGTLGAGAASGMTKAQAQAAYGAVAEVLPTAEKLSSIYAGQLDQYGQLQAEQEQIQGLASAKRARQALAQAEVAQFSGQSGTSKGSFSSGYLSRSSAAGLI